MRGLGIGSAGQRLQLPHTEFLYPAAPTLTPRPLELAHQVPSDIACRSLLPPPCIAGHGGVEGRTCAQLTASTGRALSHPTVVTPPLGDRLQPHHYPEYHPVWAWVLREDTGRPRSGLSGGDLAAELVALSCLCSPLPSHQ